MGTWSGFSKPVLNLLIILLLVECVKGSDDLVSYHYYGACRCQCTQDRLFTANNELERNNQTFGNCQSERDGKIGCYLHEKVGKQDWCKDKVFDSAANAYWSSAACFTPSYDEFPCTTTTQGRCKVIVNGEVKLNCANSKLVLLGLEEDCNVEDPACECYNLGTSELIKARFGPDARADCVAGALALRVGVTTSAGGLKAVKVNRTWKRKRSCKWVLGPNQEFRCVNKRNPNNNRKSNNENNDQPPIWSN